MGIFLNIVLFLGFMPKIFPTVSHFSFDYFAVLKPSQYFYGVPPLVELFYYFLKSNQLILSFMASELSVIFRKIFPSGYVFNLNLLSLAAGATQIFFWLLGSGLVIGKSLMMGITLILIDKGVSPCVLSLLRHLGDAY